MMILEKVDGGRVLFDPSKIAAVIEDDNRGCWVIVGPSQFHVRLNFAQMKAAIAEYEDECRCYSTE